MKPPAERALQTCSSHYASKLILHKVHVALRSSTQSQGGSNDAGVQAAMPANTNVQPLHETDVHECWHAALIAPLVGHPRIAHA